MEPRKVFIILTVGWLMGCAGNFRYYDPNKPHHGKNSFLNNYDNSPRPSLWKWQWERLTTTFPKDDPAGAPTEKKHGPLTLPKNATTATWIGQSTVLLQVAGRTILTDPIFSERASPLSFAGPRRYGVLPLQIEQLPEIDVVVISHNHYDHLDIETLKALEQHGNGRTVFFVPLGDGELLTKSGVTNVRELDWWDSEVVGPLRLIFTPAQHWSSRGLWDRNQSLWGSWTILAPGSKIFFAGDTGYSKDFQDIYERLGAMDLALLPIGAYAPRWFMKSMHVNTDEAVKIHQDLHARLSVPIHWGTFKLSDEPLTEPPQKLRESLQKAHLSPEAFYLMKRGETLQLPSNELKNRLWNESVQN